MTLSELPLDDSILKAVEAMGFTQPTPVQEAVIPQILEKEGDIIALAQTGTGKTAAFGLPLLELLRQPEEGGKALVLCPTRELALQITDELRSYAANQPRIRIDAVYGGAAYGDQIRSLKRGVDILVATPGRLVDLINKGKADLSTRSHVILDEADIMLNMGFKEELDAILDAVPQERRTILLSATMPPEVARIASTYMDNPETLTMGPKNAAAEGVEHHYFAVNPREKYAALKRLIDFHPEMYGIIFCRTKVSTQEIADRLVAEGYDVEPLHGDLSQAQREGVMKKFRRKDLQLLAATDIAARGLDVQDLSHVIHFDLPDEIEMYTHRSGRTGRAGKRGISYAIIGPRERGRLKRIEKVIKRKIQGGSVPDGDDIFERQLVDFADRLASAETNADELSPYAALLEEKLSGLSREELLQKIVAMQFDKMLTYYRDLPDMTPLREADLSSRDRRDSRRRDNYRQGKGPGRGGSNGKGSAEQEGFVEVGLNLGSRDNVTPPDLIGLVNQSSRHRGIEIGKIKIQDSRSMMQIEEEFAGHTADALNGFTYKGRRIKANIIGASNSGRRDSNGKGRNGSTNSAKSAKKYKDGNKGPQRTGKIRMAK